MYKEDIRELYREKRGDLTEEEADKLSRKITEKFFGSVDLSPVKSIHVFLHIRHKVEVNTWYIIDQLRNDHPQIKIAVSKVEPGEETMKSYLLEADTELVENKWRVPEPVSGEPFSEKDIDLVVVPLLAFDMEGFRVGYGKGFYDRFFTDCRKDVLKAGVSFFEPVDMIMDIDQYDVPLDICVTPEKVYDFKK